MKAAGQQVTETDTGRQRGDCGATCAASVGLGGSGGHGPHPCSGHPAAGRERGNYEDGSAGLQMCERRCGRMVALSRGQEGFFVRNGRVWGRRDFSLRGKATGGCLWVPGKTNQPQEAAGRGSCPCVAPTPAPVLSCPAPP